ncbi:MAG TPA: hypothetical protein VH087_20425 [Thermoanaerobaculia bacterium]|jgi:hypothetical protein|nr:hypothetical protein [Thermoanaerobaculia bacterium]
MPRSRALRSPAALFTLIALSIAIVEIAIVRSTLFARNPDIAAWGVTFDLTITIPLVYWFVLVRPGHARPVSLAPIFVVCTSAAALILPRGDQSFLHQLRWVAIPLEILTIGLLVASVWRRRPGGVRERIVGGMLTTEVAIFYYALFSWRAEPEVPADAVAISTHKRSGWGTVVVCFVVLIAFESVGVHLLVQQWSVKWAWIWTAMDVYGVLWLIGDYHALRLRPTLIREDEIELRHGMRLNATIARSNVAAVEAITNEAQWKRKGIAKVALLDEPKYLIRLREPVIAESLAGIKRKIEAIAILPDDPAAFERALTLH